MKKKINLLLLIFVISLWGYIGYRLINNSKQDTLTSHNLGKKKIEVFSVHRDTFTLEPLKRDPFLNRVIPSTTSPTTNPKGTTVAVNEKQQQILTLISWPQIEYYGYIKSGKNKELAVLKIDKQLFKLHNGESNKGIIVQNIYKDSVTIIYNKQTRTIKSSK